jgi:tetratricopeptide (TPR) repeat protein
MPLHRFVFPPLFALCLALCLCAAPLARAQTGITPQQAFDAGIEQAENGRHREAIAFFLIAYQASPESVGVLFNLGLSSAEIGEHREALKYWLALQKQRPQEWRVQAKLIQAYQALGDTQARDRTRAALLESYHAAAPGAELKRNEMYCREQMVLGGRKVLAFEHFEPQGERRTYYTFIVVGGADAAQEDYRLTYSSDEAVTRMAREMGSLAEGKSLYQLDKREAKGRTTYANFSEPQSYEAVRARVAEVMDGRIKPLSSNAP